MHVIIVMTELVSWCPFSAQIYGYIRDERSGEELSLPKYRKARDILTSTLAAFLFSSHPERDREAH